MSDVKVETQKSLARREAPGLSLFDEFFSPLYPARRLFGMSPFAMMRDFSEEMDRMFRGIGPAADTWTPVVDVQRREGNLMISAELPGLKKEDVKVEITEDALIIEGERKQEQKEERKGFYRYERSYGKFYRSIPLPEGAKADQVKAELTDGVLKINVPVPEKKVRQVAVEEGAGKKVAQAAT